MVSLRSLLPEACKSGLRRLRSLAYRGKGRFCPVCSKTSRRFLTVGTERRRDAQCAHCSSAERHRFLYLFLSRKTNLFKALPERVLHVSPTPSLEVHLQQRLGDRYLTADLYRPQAMIKMDITDIDCPDESFDVIICSHVLEHVSDDRQAMREFCRVLKRSGWAIMMVPVTAEKTFEDPSIVTPQGRLEAFGEVDHVRRYGPDFAEILRQEGFAVKVVTVSDVATPTEIESMRLTPDSGEIYLCTKGSVSQPQQAVGAGQYVRS